MKAKSFLSTTNTQQAQPIGVGFFHPYQNRRHYWNVTLSLLPNKGSEIPPTSFCLN